MKILFLLIVLLFIPKESWAITFWVSATGGTDGNCATAQGLNDPNVYIRTIQVGINCANLGATADTVVIKAGTYNENNALTSSYAAIWFQQQGGGGPVTAANKRLVIKSHTGQLVTIRPAGSPAAVAILGNWGQGYVTIDGSDGHPVGTYGITFDGVNFPQGAKHGIAMSEGSSSANWIIKQVKVTNVPYTCITDGQANSTGGHVIQYSECSYTTNNDPTGQFWSQGIDINSPNAIIEHNHIFNVGLGFTRGAAVIHGCSHVAGQNCAGQRISYNLIHDVRNGIGAYVSADPTNPTQIYGNVIYHASGYGIFIQEGANNVVLQKNTVYDVGNYSVPGDPDVLKGACFSRSGTIATFANNIGASCASASFSGISADSTNLTSSPGLVDPANGDLSNRPTSTGINSLGSILPSPGCSPALGNGSRCDVGAFETATIASAQTANSSTVNVQLGTAYAPFLDAGSTLSSCTGWTLKVDSGGGPVTPALSNCSFSGNGVVQIVCTTSCMATGDTITIAHAQTSGITDSIRIGGIKNQTLMPFGDTAVTNNLSGPPTATFTNNHFRCRTWNHNLTSIAVSSWYAPQDISCSVQSTNGKIAIINGIGCSGGNCSPSGFRYEYQTNGGSWSNVTNSCITDNFCYDNTQTGGATHGAAITAADLLTNPYATYITGAVNANDSSFPVVDLSQDSSTTIMGSFAVKNGLPVNTQICVRPKQDSGALLTYSATACFTIVNPGGTTL